MEWAWQRRSRDLGFFTLPSTYFCDTTRASHQTIQFKAGETATAEIVIRRRRIADILLDPIRQMQNGGLNL